MTAARKRKPHAAKPKPRTPTDRGPARDRLRPRVIVVGDHPSTTDLRRAVRRGGMTCEVIAAPKEALEVLADGGPRVVVLAPPLRSVSVKNFCDRAPDHIPVLVTLASEPNDARQRKLYAAGASAVFTWPDERRVLIDALSRLMAADPLGPDRVQRSTDVALEEKAKAALDTSAAAADDLHVAIIHGRANIVGSVDALWKVYEAEQAVEQVPRIRDVDVQGVVVVGEQRTDAKIAKAVRTIIHQTSEVDDSTVAFSVDDGVVTLTGSTESRHELERLEKLVRHVRGVRGVTKYMVVSKAAKSKDKKVADRVRRALAARGADKRVSVAVFGGVCVLSGRAVNLGQRRSLEDLARTQGGVERVVNKITVSSN